ncbi:MAG: hypothetical protein QOG86_715, partial [Thermoleophilaceae bacterium]|nr:hypothetical protein [Thermoleophilaceae bacterium]
MADNEKLRIVGWGVAALVAVLLGARLLESGGGDRPASVSVDSAGATPAATATHSPGGSGPELMVQVAGEVARPGVYR